MSILALVFFVVPFLTLVGLVLLVAALVQRSIPAPSEAATVARRHATWVNAAAWVTALAVAVVLGVQLLRSVWGSGLYAGVAAGLLPGFFGLVFLAVHALGERTWPRPAGEVRRAHLAPRATPRGPSWLRRLTWAWVGLLATALVAAGLTSSDGRAVAISYASNAIESTGPYPGWFYGIPLLIATVLILAATEGVLRLIGRRPAVVDTDPDYDAASRGLSAHRALRGTQLVLALTAAGVLSVMGVALGNLSDKGLGILGGTLGGLAIVVAVVGMIATTIPGRPVRTAARPTSPGKLPAQVTDDPR